MSSFSSISALADQISQSARLIEKFLQDNNLPQPSFEEDGPKTFPVGDEHPDILAARATLIDATQELRELIIGPTDTIKWVTVNEQYLTGSYQAIYRFKIAQAVPARGAISFADLATATGLTELNVTRIVRRAAINHVFVEKKRGFVSHTAISSLLAQDASMQGLVGHMTDSAFPATAQMCDYLERFPDSGEPNESPFAMAFGGPMFAKLTQEPYKMDRFIKCMSAWSVGDPSQRMVQGYDWEQLGSGTVVDIGGANGHISLAIASEFPKLSFVVQDQAPVAAQATALIATYPESVRSRVQAQAHNFFEPQPAQTHGASAYLLRYICHDWSDLYASKILGTVAAAMGPDSRLLVADAVLPPDSVKLPNHQEAILRSLDLSMLCQLNARERAIEDWERVLKMADGRLKITDVKPPSRSGDVSIIEARLVI